MLSDHDHITAPRFSSGDYLGHYGCEIVRTLPTGDSNPGYLVRFEDGHEAGAFRRELRATAYGWSLVDAVFRPDDEDTDANALHIASDDAIIREAHRRNLTIQIVE